MDGKSNPVKQAGEKAFQCSPPLFCVTPEFVSSFLSFFFLIAFPILSFLFPSTAKEEKGMRGKRKERRGLKLNATRERKKNQPYTYSSTQ